MTAVTPRRETTAIPRRERRSRSALAERRFAVLLTLPALLLFAVVACYPLVNSVLTGFLDESLVIPGTKWAGLSNFADVLHDGFFSTLGRTVVFTAGATVLSFAIGLTLALLLDTKFRGRGALRGIFLFPWVMPGVVVSFLWAWIFNANYGVLNALLKAAGLTDGDTAWLAQPGTAMAAVIVAKSWASFPWVMVMLLAALQTVSGELLEAAALDGAGRWRQIRSVKLPHLRGMILVVVLLEIVWNFQHFDTIYVMTGGGPAQATSTLAVSVYHTAFVDYDLGHAAALGTLWLLVLAVPSAAFLWLAGRDEASR